MHSQKGFRDYDLRFFRRMEKRRLTRKGETGFGIDCPKQPKTPRWDIFKYNTGDVVTWVEASGRKNKENKVFRHGKIIERGFNRCGNAYYRISLRWITENPRGKVRFCTRGFLGALNNERQPSMSVVEKGAINDLVTCSEMMFRAYGYTLEELEAHKNTLLENKNADCDTKTTESKAELGNISPRQLLPKVTRIAPPMPHSGHNR